MGVCQSRCDETHHHRAGAAGPATISSHRTYSFDDNAESLRQFLRLHATTDAKRSSLIISPESSQAIPPSCELFSLPSHSDRDDDVAMSIPAASPSPTSSRASPAASSSSRITNSPSLSVSRNSCTWSTSGRFDSVDTASMRDRHVRHFQLPLLLPNSAHTISTGSDDQMLTATSSGDLSDQAARRIKPSLHRLLVLSAPGLELHHPHETSKLPQGAAGKPLAVPVAKTRRRRPSRGIELEKGCEEATRRGALADIDMNDDVVAMAKNSPSVGSRSSPSPTSPRVRASKALIRLSRALDSREGGSVVHVDFEQSFPIAARQLESSNIAVPESGDAKNTEGLGLLPIVSSVSILPGDFKLEPGVYDRNHEENCSVEQPSPSPKVEDQSTSALVSAESSFRDGDSFEANARYAETTSHLFPGSSREYTESSASPSLSSCCSYQLKLKLTSTPPSRTKLNQKLVQISQRLLSKAFNSLLKILLVTDTEQTGHECTTTLDQNGSKL